jgi:hypothetical protein
MSRAGRTSTLRGALIGSVCKYGRAWTDACSRDFEQPDLDAGTYASMLEQLMPVLHSAKGFMSHAGGPSPAGGTRIIEIWEWEADSQNFFNEILKPNLPPGVVPDTTYYELHAAFTR